MTGKRSAKWMLALAGSALLVLYILSYLWFRQGHYLVHRVTWGGEERVHNIATGDPGQMNASWWFTTTHTIPYVEPVPNGPKSNLARSAGQVACPAEVEHRCVRALDGFCICDWCCFGRCPR